MPLAKKREYDTTRVIHLPLRLHELLMWSITVGLPQCKIEPHANVLPLKVLIEEMVGILVWLQCLKYSRIELGDDAIVGPTYMMTSAL